MENPFVETFNAKDVLQVRSALTQDGMLIFGNKKGTLMGLCVPGEYSHVGVYDRRLGLIYEMVSSGFQTTTVASFVTRYSSVAVTRCSGFTSAYAFKFIRNIMVYKGVPYDSAFNFSVESLYCSELVYRADVNHVIKCSTEDLLGLGKKYISPMGIFNAANMLLVLKVDK